MKSLKVAIDEIVRNKEQITWDLNFFQNETHPETKNLTFKH